MLSLVFQFLCNIFALLLLVFQGNVGIVTVVLAVLIRLLIWPGYQKAIISQRKLSRIQPQIKKIQDLVPEESLKYLAETITKNIRELEGALNRLIINAKLKNKTLSLEETKKIISSLIKTPKEYISPKKVIKKIASFYDLPEKDILSHSRKKELVKPRQIIMYLLREELGYSYTNIAEKLGQRDHTTVIHAYKKISAEIEKNPVFAQEILLLKDLLYNK